MTADPLAAAIGHMMNAQFALECGTKREALDILRRGVALARTAIAGEAQRGETTQIGSTGTASTRAEGIAQPRAA